MSFYEKINLQKEKLNSFLCIGLDPEEEKLPESIKNSPTPLLDFCKGIVDATCEEAVCFKPNIAFFERRGSRGFSEFEKLIRYIKITYPQTPIIADVKRGDLANTAKEYSKYYFDELGVDSVTLSPYMGKDSIEPFLKMSKGHVFLLCLTSNPSSSDFQKLKTSDDIFFYKEVAKFSDLLNQEFHNQVGIVVGGTHPKEIGDLRKTHKELNFLIPGYGAQGGSLEDIVKNSGPNSIINSSRSIIFSSSGKNFSDSAKLKAIEINNEMKKLYQKALLQNKILK